MTPKMGPKMIPKMVLNAPRRRTLLQTSPGGAREAQNLIKSMKTPPRNLLGKKDGKREAESSH